MMATDEDDAAFLKRMLRAIDDQASDDERTEPARVTLDAKDVERLVKLYAGIPPSALRVH